MVIVTLCEYLGFIPTSTFECKDFYLISNDMRRLLLASITNFSHGDSAPLDYSAALSRNAFAYEFGTMGMTSS